MVQKSVFYTAKLRILNTCLRVKDKKILSYINTQNIKNL